MISDWGLGVGDGAVTNHLTPPIPNPQPPVLETGALPIELLAYNSIGELASWRLVMSNHQSPNHQITNYFDSLCAVCFRQKRQNFENSSRSVVFFLFFVVL